MIPLGILFAAALANLLPGANASLIPPTNGVYIGDGLVPVPAKLATKIQHGEFIDMGELLPEFWPSSQDDDGQKSETKTCRGRKVTDILTWLQSYGTYVSVVADSHPSRIAVLTAYVILIIQVNQEFAGLAWVRYDADKQHQMVTGERYTL